MVLSIPIPLDIISGIIEQLRDDPDTLKSTAFVSHSFLLFSQRHLFKKIHLKIAYCSPDDRERARRLRSFFASNPTLALYVRDFSLDITDLSHPQTMTYPQSIHISDTVLPDIFDALKRLRRLSLSGLWGRQTPRWKTVVLNMCRSPGLSDLCLCGIEKFPILEIPQLRQLRRLTLSNCSLSPNEPGITVRRGGDPSAPDERYWLEVLEFDIQSTGVERFWEMMTQPQTPLSASQLRVLGLVGTNSEVRRDVWKILQELSGSLECLIWEHAFIPVIDLLVDPNHWAPHDMGPINFGILDNLRFIAFSFVLHGPINDRNTRFTWILKCLRHMGERQNHLEEFALALFPNPSTPVTFPLEEWTAPLESVLTGGGFGSLTKLSIRLHSPYPDFQFPPTMDTLVSDCFPLLRSTGKLWVMSSCEETHMHLFEDFITNIMENRRMNPSGV